jgi:hypothetical protein
MKKATIRFFTPAAGANHLTCRRLRFQPLKCCKLIVSAANRRKTESILPCFGSGRRGRASALFKLNASRIQSRAFVSQLQHSSTSSKSSSSSSSRTLSVVIVAKFVLDTPAAERAI